VWSVCLYLTAVNEGGGLCVVLMSVEVLDVLILMILKHEREQEVGGTREAYGFWESEGGEGAW
jgi:hypothetical protein